MENIYSPLDSSSYWKLVSVKVANMNDDSAYHLLVVNPCFKNYVTYALPFSCKHLYIKSYQVGETNKRTVVVVLARVYRQNSSRSVNESCNWKDCTQEVEKIPVKEIMMMRRGCWLLCEEVEKIPSKGMMMMMMMKGLLLLEEKPHWSQWFLLGKTIGCLHKSPWQQQQ